jgi:hypothetical protein
LGAQPPGAINAYFLIVDLKQPFSYDPAKTNRKGIILYFPCFRNAQIFMIRFLATRGHGRTLKPFQKARRAPSMNLLARARNLR